jgi:hypothetical protein
MNSKARYAQAESALFSALEVDESDTLDSYKCWLESRIHAVGADLAKSPASTWDTPEFKEMARQEKEFRDAYGCLLDFKHRRLNGSV